MIGRTGEGLASFVAKLDRRRALPTRERDALLALPTATRDYDAHQCILVQDDERTVCAMLETGIAARRKPTIEGGNRIVALAIPGDMVDLPSLLLPYADFDVVTLTSATVATVRHADILDTIVDLPLLATALWLDTLVDAAIRDVRAASNSRNSERDRLAHLLLELDARFARLGSIFEGPFQMPVSHVSLGEALDMTASQVDHALSSLQDDGLLSIENDGYTIHRRDELNSLCGFDRAYLQIDPYVLRHEDRSDLP